MDNKHGQHQMTFQTGESGNPQGRPKGSSRRQQLFNNLVAPHADALIEKAIDMAKCGDTQMLKLFLERILPAKPVDEPIFLNLPNELTLESAMSMGKDILNLVNNGEATPEEAKNLFSLVKFYQENIAGHELLNSYKRLLAVIQK